MKWPLHVALFTCAFAVGCQRPAGSVPDANHVRLELLDQVLSRKGLVQDYRVVNPGPGDIYVICPEASCGDSERYLSLPFYEVHESSILSVYAYFASIPGNWRDVMEYPFVLMRVAPGELRGRIEIEAPLRNNPPYPPPPFQPYSIDGFWMDKIQLTLGILPCPDLDSEAEKSAKIPEITGKTTVTCGSTTGRARSFQKLITAEAHLQWTGCWPNAPGGPLGTSCAKEDDAGR